MLWHPMRLFVSSVLLLAGLLGSADSLAAGEEASVSVSTEALFPGDLLQLQLEARSEGYVQWTLGTPRHPHLRLLSAQEFPVELEAGSAYAVRWTLSYQAIEPGSGVLADGFLQPEEGAEAVRLALPERSVAVESFAEASDHAGLEPLAEEPAFAESRSWRGLWLLATLLAGFIAVLLWGRSRRSAKVPVEPPHSPRTRMEGEIEAIIAIGVMSRREAQSLIANYGGLLGSETHAALELIAYSKSGDAKDALIVLGRELSS